MRKLILILGFLLVAIPVKASNDVYLAENAGGSGDGSSCANARAASYFNSSSSWGTQTGQIGPGTTVHLCGTITIALVGQAAVGGTITVKWETGAKLSQPAGTNFIITGNHANNWVFDGGFPCGTLPTGNVACNGVVENTANGTNLPNQVSPVKAFDFSYTTGTIEVKNLAIQNLYQHKAYINLTGMTSDGSTHVTATCATTCGFVAGEKNISVGRSSNSAYNVTSSISVFSTSGTTLVLTYPTTIAAGSGGAAIVGETNPANTSINAVFADLTNASINVHDCTIHDASWAISYNVRTAGIGVRLEVARNNIYNIDHGFAMGTIVGSPSYSYVIHDNWFHDFHAWDNVPNFYHHDGIHDFSDQTDGTAKIIYNNLFGGGTIDFQDNTTSFVFLQGDPQNVTMYNNVYRCSTSSCPNSPAGLWEDGAGPNQRVYNNTFIQTGGPHSTTPPYPNGATVINDLLHGGPSGNNSFMNNISTSGTTLMNSIGAIYASNTGTTGLDYNLYANYITNGNKAFDWNGTTTTDDFPTWQGASGEGSHSSFVSSAALNPDGSLQTGSPAIGKGTNLSSLCSETDIGALCSDTTAGNMRAAAARPTSGAWDIGAFQHATSGHAINVVQVLNHTYANNTTLYVTFTETSGNFLIAATGYVSNVTGTVSDTLGNTWHPLPAQGNGNSGCGASASPFSGSQLWYAENIKGGSNKVTLTLSSQAFLWLDVIEYSGVKTSGSLLASNGSISNTVVSSISTGNISAGAASNLIVAAFTDTDQGRANMSAGTGYTDEGNAGIGAIFEDLLSAPPGTYNPSASYNYGSDYCGAATGAAFSSQ